MLLCACAVEGVLKGYDALLNLVLDDCDEFMPGERRVGALCVATQAAAVLTPTLHYTSALTPR